MHTLLICAQIVFGLQLTIGRLRHTVSLGTDIFGNIQRMENTLDTLHIKEQSCKDKLEDLEKQLETAKNEVQKPFAKEAELNEKLVRVEQLNALLNMDNNEQQTDTEEREEEDEFER